MTTLIAYTGRAGAGKDTAAQALITHGFQRMAFADCLKEVVALLADEPVAWYHDPVRKEEFSPTLGMTRRSALQLMGTEGVRKIFGPDFWAQRLLSRWRRLGRPNAVITDCRFDNEAGLVRMEGGTVVKVVRPGSTLDGVQMQHASEAGVSEDLVDIYIYNDGTPEDLQALAVESLLKDVWGAND